VPVWNKDIDEVDSMFHWHSQDCYFYGSHPWDVVLQYPYYEHKDKTRMYTVGSLFYAIYFWISFPTFFIMDENVRAKKWPLWRAAWDALAAAMLVTVMLDLWRLAIGPIFGRSQEFEGMPFMNGQS
jgi:hypothetical protein